MGASFVKLIDVSVQVTHCFVWLQRHECITLEEKAKRVPRTKKYYK